MKNKKYLIAGVVIVAIVIVLVVGNKEAEKAVNDESVASTTETVVKKPQIKPVSKPKAETDTSKSPSTLIKTNTAPSGYPEIEFIDKTLSFPLPNYDRINVRAQKVVFGRGEATASTGCQGIPNTNFAAYLYPGDGICISNDLVDGAPRGIIALHLLIENNGNYNFGGNSKVMQLHYLRASSSGAPVHRFAYPLNSLASYNIVPYSSKEIILSYLVPEDQPNFNLLFDYTGVLSPDLSQNVYANASGGLFIDFKNKTVSLIK